MPCQVEQPAEHQPSRLLLGQPLLSPRLSHCYSYYIPAHPFLCYCFRQQLLQFIHSNLGMSCPCLPFVSPPKYCRHRVFH
jgi:hypothetical protein